MCFVASEQNTHTSTDELLETGKENSCTCRKTKKAEHSYLRMDFPRILRLALLQKGNKTMIKCFQDSTSCVRPSSRTVSHSPFRHRSIQGKKPFYNTKQQIANSITNTISCSTAFQLSLSQEITAGSTSYKTKTIKNDKLPSWLCTIPDSSHYHNLHNAKSIYMKNRKNQARIW